MNEMEHLDLRTDSSYELRYPRWNPCLPSLYHMSLFGKYRHQLFTISLHESRKESRWFQFFAGALKNILSRRLGAFWTRVGQVTGTKQLFCHGIMTACWVLRPRLTYVWRNMNIFNIFLFFKVDFNKYNNSSLWDTLKMILLTKCLIKWKRIGRISWKFWYWLNLKSSIELNIQR